MAQAHYEVLNKFFEPYMKRITPLWDETKKEVGLNPLTDSQKEFDKKFETALRSFLLYDLRNHAQDMPLSPLQMSYMMSVVPWIIFDDLYDRFLTREGDSVAASFATFSHSAPFAYLIYLMVEVMGGPDATPLLQEQLRMTVFASLISKFHFRALEHYGKKIYEVAPELEWALLPEHTAIKNYPADHLRLPFPSIYVDLPSKFRIYNELTSWHSAEGAYISEDCLRSPRAWRIVLVAGKNDQAEGLPYDDAIYHFTVLFKEGETVDTCLKHTAAHALGEKSDQILVTADGEIEIRSEVEEAHREIWNLMYEHTVEAFRYIMNVVLYATSSESDQVFRHASRDYRTLYERAMRAKDKKRRKLFARLRERHDDEKHIYLGGSFTIDRKKEASEADGTGTGSKQKVRYMVSGHWRSQPYGKDRKLRKPVWIKPHWRGPEMAPVTERTRKLK